MGTFDVVENKEGVLVMRMGPLEFLDLGVPC
jgi:hypothetical protein